MHTASEALGAIQKAIVNTPQPIAQLASASVGLAEEYLSDTFGTGFYKLPVHPWMFGVGKGEGIGIQLSFPNLVRTIARKFADAHDRKRPVFSSNAEVEAIVVSLGAPSLIILRPLLESLGQIFSTAEFELALRRIRQAFELEETQCILPKAPRLPLWKSAQLRDIGTLGEVERNVKAFLALLKGYSKGLESSCAIALKAVQRKADQMQKGQARFQAAMAVFNRGLETNNVQKLYARAMGTKALAEEIGAATGAPGHEFTVSAGICFVAPSGGLTPLKNALQWN